MILQLTRLHSLNHLCGLFPLNTMQLWATAPSGGWAGSVWTQSDSVCLLRGKGHRWSFYNVSPVSVCTLGLLSVHYLYNLYYQHIYAYNYSPFICMSFSSIHSNWIIINFNPPSHFPLGHMFLLAKCLCRCVNTYSYFLSFGYN